MAAVPTIGRASGVEGAAAPEADLTRALYEQYAPQIFRYCLHQLGSREEAEDAVQSTFLNAFRGLKRGVVPELESAWLFKIAHNVCLSRRRSTWRRGRIEAPTDFDLVEEVAPAPSRRADELIGLQDVLEQMPEQQRRAILLREWQGLSYREISDELELSQAAVETLIFRARRTLAQGLEQPVAVRQRKRRLGAGIFGNLLSAGQSFLYGGGAAVKVAATVAAVSAGTVVATAPVHHRAGPAAPAGPTAPHRPTVRASHAPAPIVAAVVHHGRPAVRQPVTRPPARRPSVAAPPAARPAAPTVDTAPAARAGDPASIAPAAPQSEAPGQVRKQEDGVARAGRGPHGGRGDASGRGRQVQPTPAQPTDPSTGDGRGPSDGGGQADTPSTSSGKDGAPGQQKKQPDAPVDVQGVTVTTPVVPVPPSTVPTGDLVQPDHGQGRGDN